MKPGKPRAAKGVKKVSSLAAKKERPVRIKEGRRGDSSSSSDDDMLEEQLLPSRLVQELKIEELQEQVHAIKGEIKNLQKTVVEMSKKIHDLKKQVQASIANI